MKITEEMVDYISVLSRLRLPEEERGAMAAELERIVSYMDVLESLDTTGVAPRRQVVPVNNVMRPDRVVPSWPRADLLWNAPGHDDEAFLVPKAVE